MARTVGFDKQRENVVMLLKDRGNDLTGGSMIKDFAEMGAHQGGGSVFTAEYIRRYFGVPKNRDADDAIYTEEYVDNLRGASHVLLEVRLRELKRTARTLWRRVVEVFPRDEGAHSDYESLKEKAAEERRLRRLLSEAGGEKAKKKAEAKEGLAESAAPSEAEFAALMERVAEGEEAALSELDALAVRGQLDAEARLEAIGDATGALWLCDRGVDVLTLGCWDDELFVEFARGRSAREEAKMEEANAAIAHDYEDLKAHAGTSEKDAAEIVATRNGISTSRVRQIAEGQRLARGEEKRKPGRPRKEAG